MTTPVATTASCKNCALLLARIVGERHWWFRFVRSPLVWGMRFLALWHRIDARRWIVTEISCEGCIRFIKTELEQRSPTFRWLNGLIGKRFTALRDSRLTAKELAEAKRFAAEAMTPPEVA